MYNACFKVYYVYILKLSIHFILVVKRETAYIYYMSTHKNLPPIELVKKILNDVQEKEWIKQQYQEGYLYKDIANALKRSTMYVKDRVRFLVEANQVRPRKPGAWRNLKEQSLPIHANSKEDKGPKQRSGNSSTKGMKPGWTRSSILVKIETIEKINAIATWERKDKKYVTEEAFQLLLDQKKNILARALALHRERILSSNS